MLFFRQMFEKDTATYTYLLAADYNRDAIIIDPVKEKCSLYLELLKQYGLTLKISLDTHVHADHITASADLQQATQCQIVMGKMSKAVGVNRFVDDGETIEIDGVKLTALYTPGHTDDSYCYLMSDRVFTGDTLLIRGTGRTDFQHGSNHDAYQSLTEKLLTLPDETKVYPAHDYQGMTMSTIGEEKRFNPRLQVKSEAEYSYIMDNLNLDYPKNFDVAVPANLRCGRDK